MPKPEPWFAPEKYGPLPITSETPFASVKLSVTVRLDKVTFPLFSIVIT